MWLGAVRDIAIVLLALESLVIGVLLALMLLQLRKLVRLLREEIAPLLNSANETVGTVHATVDFVSQSVVDPLIRASSYATGTVHALRNLLFVGRRLGRRSNGDSGPSNV
ncbi:MAG: hypothetical protein JXA74_13495 [Anaerolineae bacterium]|nr:hypothetical protein [Anaerolineae bacterium]